MRDPIYIVHVRDHPVPAFVFIGPFDAKEEGKKVRDTMRIMWDAHLVELYDWNMAATWHLSIGRAASVETRRCVLTPTWPCTTPKQAGRGY